MIRQIFEKCYEHNIDWHNISVDYTKALDSIYRNKIAECLAQYRVPGKLMTELALFNIKARVMINNDNKEEFKVESGTKQGDLLSATLFSVDIDVILKQLGLRGNTRAG